MTRHPREQQILARLRDGAACKVIARELGVTAYYVYVIRDAHNIPNWYADPNGPACKHGHAWPENLGKRENGYHVCLECRRENGRKSRVVDPIVVSLAVSGQAISLKARERRQVVRQLLTTDLTGTQMAARANCTPRTIWRIRKQLREVA